MSLRRLDAEQPESFAFDAANAAWAKEQIAKYPEGKQASTVIPLLWRAQEQNDGWLPEPAIRHVAELLDMAFIRVYEVATFYTMFNLSPVGKYFVQLCGTTPCWLRGAEALKDVCNDMIGSQRQLSEDGLFSWLEVECLGACVNAPMVQINKDYYEDLTPESFKAVLQALKEGKEIDPGPQVARQKSCPLMGPTTLAEEANGTASSAGVAADLNERDKPILLKKARKGGADDLCRIPGIGRRLAALLNAEGVFHFEQIASWSDANASWVDATLGLKGRAAREDWIASAKALAAEEGR